MFHKVWFLASRASECRQVHRLTIVKDKELTIFINRDPCKTDEEVINSARGGGVGGWKGWERLWRGRNI